MTNPVSLFRGTPPKFTTSYQTTKSINPHTDYNAYYPRDNGGCIAAIHMREGDLHVAASNGRLEFFEGPGPDPTILMNYAENKIWLRQNAGAQAVEGDILVWNRATPVFSEANWVPIDFEGYRRHLRLGNHLEFTQSTPATAWTINHNFGVRPIIQVSNLGWTNAAASPSFAWPSDNQVIISFASPTAGHAILCVGAFDGGFGFSATSSGTATVTPILF